MTAEEREARLNEITDALDRDPTPDERRRLIREYLDLTEPMELDL